MAGNTSRFFLTLTIPSVFGFVGLLWLLKRKISPSSPKRLFSKAIQVESPSESEEFEKQFSVLDSMKLKEKEDSCEGSVSVEMQLKDTQSSQSPVANGVQQNGTAKGKKSKSKIREKASTCPKDYILAESDRHSSMEDDNGIDLSNGIDEIDLNDEELLQNSINKSRRDMEVANGTNSSSTTRVLINGDSEKSVVSETDDRPTLQNGGAKELCDTEVVSLDGRGPIPDTCEKTDSPTSPHQTEPLTLPVDSTDASGEMLESPGATYCDSVGSYDSGKGGSEIQYDSYQARPSQTLTYEFEILQEYVGLLIGRKGRHVQFIKEETNANILIKRHPTEDKKKVCSITGAEEEIHAALKLIRKRFPVETYPTVTLSQLFPVPIEYQHPELLRMSLPVGVSFEVMLSATVNAGHFFLQQPTLPTYHSLFFFSAQMNAHYSQDIAPPMSFVDKGNICAANCNNEWYRAEIVDVFEESDECRVKFLDYGGYLIVPRRNLKQIRYDFLHLPFQATECYLGDVALPDGASDWSREATRAFEELGQGQILQGYVVAFAENKVPFVKLFRFTGAEMIDINQELVRLGFAKSLSEAPQ